MMTKELINSSIRLKKDADGNPLYIRVREHILHELITGNFAPGDKYMTENELAEKLSVSRNTVRKAVDDLEQNEYLKRHRRIGIIIKNSPIFEHRDEPSRDRQRVVVIFPRWNDSSEGFYTGKLLSALSLPNFSPRFAVEVRHHNDPITDIRDKDTALIPIDPEASVFADLQHMARAGRKIIVIEPRQPIPGLVNLFSDRRGVVCQAVKKFYELGHKNVGMVNHNLGHIDYERSLIGYLDAHRELGIPIPLNGLVQYSTYSDVRILPDVRNITAWVCTYLGALNIVAEQCRLEGLRVPEDVSLISLDDPGDITLASIGKKVSVVHNDPEAAAALIHAYITDWREDRTGTMTFIPSQWKDRETIAPPSNCP